MRRTALAIAPVLAILLAAASLEARERGVELDLGDAATSAISPAGDLDDWLFDGVAGTKAAFSVAAAASPLTPSLLLLTPDGTPIGTLKAKGTKASLLAVLPSTGRYTLRVSGTGGTEGAYNLATKGKAPTSVKRPPAVLLPGQTVDFEVHGDDLSVISVKLTAPSYAVFKVVAILDPDGKAVFGALDAFGPARDARTGTFSVYSGFGTYVIRLGNASAETAVSLAAKITGPRPVKSVVNAPADEPRPAAVNPSSGPPGAWVRVTGSGFRGECSVWFGEAAAPTLNRLSTSEIEARVPASAPRDTALDVAVRSPEGQENSLPAAFTVLTPPTVLAVWPTRVPPGGMVVVTGASFADGAQVLIGATAASAVTFVNAQTLEATVPASMPEGQFNVTVRNPDQLTASLSDALAVEIPPTVTGVAPDEVERGDTVHVYGTDFLPGSSVQFSGVPSTTTAWVSAGELTALLPLSGLPDGLLDVTVVKPFGSPGTLDDALTLHPSPAWAGLVLTGIIDGPRSGGYPKAVEMRATADLPSLSGYTLRLASNGATWSSTLALTGSATKGQFLYAAYESPGFMAYFGFAPNFVNTSVLNFNGNDAIGLFLSNVLVDVYGDYTQVSSSADIGDPWAYQDGYAVRRTPYGPQSTFSTADWTFSGNDALDAQGTSGVNGTAGITVPFGTWFWR